MRPWGVQPGAALTDHCIRLRAPTHGATPQVGVGRFGAILGPTLFGVLSDAGFSTAEESNKRYHYLLARGGVPVVLAPMAGITDLPFRRRVARFGAGLVVSEMVASGEMITERPSVRAKARTDLGLGDASVPTSVPPVESPDSLASSSPEGSSAQAGNSAKEIGRASCRERVSSPV